MRFCSHDFLRFFRAGHRFWRPRVSRLLASGFVSTSWLFPHAIKHKVFRSLPNASRTCVVASGENFVGQAPSETFAATKKKGPINSTTNQKGKHSFYSGFHYRVSATTVNFAHLRYKQMPGQWQGAAHSCNVRSANFGMTHLLAMQTCNCPQRKKKTTKQKENYELLLSKCSGK